MSPDEAPLHATSPPIICPWCGEAIFDVVPGETFSVAIRERDAWRRTAWHLEQQKHPATNTAGDIATVVIVFAILVGVLIAVVLLALGPT